MELVFTGAFPCPICERDLPFSVYGLGIPADMAYFKQPQALAGAQDHARHEHWCRVHRLCAICGKHVTSGESGDLDCAVNDGRIRIHSGYNDYFQKVERGDISRLLIVHRGCAEEIKQ